MAVTHYNGEASPAATRGLLAGSMLLFNALGNLWGAGMSRAYATETADKGWLIPQAVQFIPAILILGLIWFTPESPRWLLLKGKKDEALTALNRLRPKRDVAAGNTERELNAIEQNSSRSCRCRPGQMGAVTCYNCAEDIRRLYGSTQTS